MMGFLAENLRAAGIDPAGTDKIVVTHGHPVPGLGQISRRGSGYEREPIVWSW